MSGANNVLPSIPIFTAGAPTIAQLNALSYAVSFLADQDVRPTWHFWHNATVSLSASTWNQMPFAKTAYDCDSVYSSANKDAIIVTQGYYALEANFELEATSTDTNYIGAFRITFGNNNPGGTQGTTRFFGYRGSMSSNTSDAAADNACCLSALTPLQLYPGDRIDVMVYVSSAMTADYNTGTPTGSYIQGRFSANFTGYWAFTPPLTSALEDQAFIGFTDQALQVLYDESHH